MVFASYSLVWQVLTGKRRNVQESSAQKWEEQGEECEPISPAYTEALHCQPVEAHTPLFPTRNIVSSYHTVVRPISWTSMSSGCVSHVMFSASNHHTPEPERRSEDWYMGFSVVAIN